LTDAAADYPARSHAPRCLAARAGAAGCCPARF